MTIPEWVLVTLVTCILAVLGWAATRLVKANDDTALSLSDIVRTLGLVNGRLGRTEVWQQMHGDDDARRFQAIAETHNEMWHVINQRQKS